LSKKIEQIHQESRKTYGSPRIQEALAFQGFPISRQRVMRLMAKLGINSHLKRKFKVTTDSSHLLPIAENILARNFTVNEPDQAWVADITYISTGEGWLYLAVIVDLFSRKVVGWSMAEHMRTELVLTALDAALGQRKPSESGLIFHSDRGSQYASQNYQNALLQANINCSMSRRGNCWDNAVAESFFGSLKTEFIYTTTFPNRSIARTAIAEWIEVFYNRQRLHSTIGFLSPQQFEPTFRGLERRKNN
jgi:transposase InsO family protein